MGFFFVGSSADVFGAKFLLKLEAGDWFQVLLHSRRIAPCLPTPADKPPSGRGWLHEIKHDGFRLVARRDADRVRLFTRNGQDWFYRFPLIVEACSHALNLALSSAVLRYRRARCLLSMACGT